MKKRETLALNATLKNFLDVQSSNAKFSYAVDRNIKKMKDEVESLEKVLKPFEEERIAIIKEMAKKDDKGEIIFSKENKDAPEFEDKAKLEEKLKELQEKYETTFKEYKELLEEESEIELYKIPVEYFDGLSIFNRQKNEEIPIKLSGRDIAVFTPMIKED